MYDLKIRYLASAFVDAESIVPDATHALEFLKALGDDKFLPAIVHQLSPSGPIPRLGFRTLDDTSHIMLMGNRFDYSLLSKNPEGSDLGGFADFCKQAKIILALALNFFQRKSYRLAAVQEGFVGQMASQEIDTIALRIFNFPPFYKQLLPFEWDWRVASIIEREFSGSKEPTNTLTTIKRIPTLSIDLRGNQPSQVSSDRLRIDFDINTITTNKVARFGEQQIHGFFDHVHMWHEALSSEIFSFILGK